MSSEDRIDWLCRLRSDLNNGILFTPWRQEYVEALDDVLDPKNKSYYEYTKEAAERM